MSLVSPPSTSVTDLRSQNSQISRPPLTMGARFHLFLVCVTVFSHLFSHTLAEIRFTDIRFDARPIIPFDEFGFTHTGRLELNVSKISFSNPNVELSKLGFFLCTRDSWLHVLQQIEDVEITCALFSNVIKQVYTFDKLAAGQTGKSARAAGISPERRFHETSRWVKFRQEEMEMGMEELMELLGRERVVREGRRQRKIGKGPASEESGRTTDSMEEERRR